MVNGPALIQCLARVYWEARGAAVPGVTLAQWDTVGERAQQPVEAGIRAVLDQLAADHLLATERDDVPVPARWGVQFPGRNGEPRVDDWGSDETGARRALPTYRDTYGDGVQLVAVPSHSWTPVPE